MRFKKLLALLLALTLLTSSLCGCGKKSDSSSSSDEETSVADETDAPADDTEAPEDETEAPETLPPADDQPRSDAISPLLWQVKYGGNTVYLYGTMHLGDKRSKTMLNKLKPYLSQCSLLGLEIDNQALETDYETTMRIYSSYIYTNGDTIKDHIRADLYEKCVDYLTEAGYYSSYYDRFKLGFWVDILEYAVMDKMESLSMDYAMEELLTSCANDNDIPIVSIEDPVEHALITSNLSDDLNNMLIEELFDTMDTYEEDTFEFYETWLRGNRNELNTAILEEEDEDEMTEEEIALSKEYNKALLTDRNKIMADRMEEYLKGDKPMFFAVGAAHYFGENGIINLLEDKGYQVDPIYVDSVSLLAA